jgi:hypothetical protein
MINTNFTSIRGVIVTVIAAALCSGGAAAQESPASAEAMNAMLGNWELSNADRDKVCRFVFRPDTAAGGYKVDIDKICATLFPSTKDVTGWTLDSFGTLRLLDKAGNPVVELVEAENGIFDGFQPGEGRYVLQVAAAAPIRSAEELIGDWAIARGTGKPICVLTLTNNPVVNNPVANNPAANNLTANNPATNNPATNSPPPNNSAANSPAANNPSANNPPAPDNLSLKVKPGCDPFVARFGPASWRIDRGELVLVSPRGQTWRFEEDDPSTWSRVPATEDPVLLVRQP